MKDFLLIFRVLYKNRYAVSKESNGGKRKLTSQTVMTLSLLPMVAVICVMLGFVSAELTTRYSAMTLLNAILSAVQLFILFMTLPTVLGTLYSAEDAAFIRVKNLLDIFSGGEMPVFVYFDDKKILTKASGRGVYMNDTMYKLLCDILGKECVAVKSRQKDKV